ncbi:MAG: hypothetical protein CMF43_02850 [Legionellales bacterium]|nr:hypothetical protein [Legionellales bacterium]
MDYILGNYNKENKMANSISQEQKTYHQLVQELVDFVNGKKFKTFAGKVHRTVNWTSIADRIKHANDKLLGHQENIIEWYLECNQINSEILCNLATSIGANVVELATHVPVIKEVSMIIDQIIRCTLHIGDQIISLFKHENGDKAENLPDQVDLDSPYGLRTWYHDHLKTSVDEIKHTYHQFKAKVDQSDDGYDQLSALAASIQIAGIMIKMQARIVTGLLTIPARKIGELGNHVLDRVEILDIWKTVASYIRKTFEKTVTFATESEADLIDFLDRSVDCLTRVESIDDGDKHQHRP